MESGLGACGGIVHSYVSSKSVGIYFLLADRGPSHVLLTKARLLDDMDITWCTIERSVLWGRWVRE